MGLAATRMPFFGVMLHTKPSMQGFSMICFVLNRTDSFKDLGGALGAGTLVPPARV